MHWLLLLLLLLLQRPSSLVQAAPTGPSVPTAAVIPALESTTHSSNGPWVKRDKVLNGEATITVSICSSQSTTV